MPILQSDILYKHSYSLAAGDGEATYNDLGGYASSTSITSALMENVFAKVTAGEAATGSTTYHGFFVKNNHGTLTLQDAVAFFSADVPTCLLNTQLETSGVEETVDCTDNSAFPTEGAFFIADEEITYTGKSGSGAVCHFTGCTRGSNTTAKVQHIIGSLIQHNQVFLAVEAPNTQPTGHIQTIANDTTAPTGLSGWYNVGNYADGVVIGDLVAGRKYGIWLRRKVPMGSWAVSDIHVTVRVEGVTDA